MCKIILHEKMVLQMSFEKMKKIKSKKSKNRTQTVT